MMSAVHVSASSSTRRHRLGLCGLALLVSGAAFSIAGVTAKAAVIADPVTNITVTPSNPRIVDPVRTDVTWCVPDSTAAGDSFSIALPPELTQLPHGFALREPGGVVVATASIQGTPAVATFTFNDYVDTHVNVCGTAFFESRLSSSLTAGNSYTLTYVVNGTTTFQPVITITPGGTPAGRNTGRKGAFFADPSDECRTVATNCIAWYVESRLGPFQSVTITDDGITDATFDCATLVVNLWSVDANGVLKQAFAPASVGAAVQTTCSTAGFQAVVTNVPAGLLVRAVVRATPNAQDPLGGVNFTNSATITHVTSAGTSTADNVNGQRRSARVGGDASGVNAPTTTVATTAPSTTEAPAVLPPLPTSTTTTAPGFASSPVLPATGSGHNVLLLVGVGLLILGATMSVAARRPRARRA